MSPSEQRLAEIYRALRFVPVEPESAYYVRIWEDLPYDPVSRLRRIIVNSEVQSLQFFSGFAGSGKSTQLRRLKKELESDGYLVIHADAEGYLNLGEPIDITDLLYTLAGALSDGLEDSHIALKEGYWARFSNFLRDTKVEFNEASLQAGPVALKAELRANPTLRQQIQQHLAGRVRELINQVHGFVDEAAKRALDERGGGTRIVFLFDSLEKLRGSPSNEQEIMDRLERLFRSHRDALQLPSIHCVYSVPAWLPYVISGAQVVMIPAIKLRASRDSDLASEQGWRKLREIVERRMEPDGRRLLFGNPEGDVYPLADKLIEVSGGAHEICSACFKKQY